MHEKSTRNGKDPRGLASNAVWGIQNESRSRDIIFVIVTAGKARNMISEPNGASPPIEAKDHARQPEARWRARPRIIYILVVLMLASVIGGVVFTFSLPSLSNWLWFVYLICLPAFSVVFLSALFRRRWNELARCLVIGPIVLFPLYAKTGSLRWLYVEAFRLHASPTEGYLARCKLIEFIENGTKQVLGKCDSLDAGADAGLFVLYDTTGELLLPVSQRTPAWRAAMGHFSPHAVLIDTEGRAEKLLGNFYEIIISPNEFDGDNSGD